MNRRAAAAAGLLMKLVLTQLAASESAPSAPSQPGAPEQAPSAPAPAEISAFAAPPIRGFALGTGGGGGVALTRSPYFPLKAQPWYTAGLTVETPLFRWFGLGFDLSFRGTGPSDIAAGFLYRGHRGMSAGTFLTGRGRLSRAGERLDLIGGIAVGAAAGFEVYDLTELLFFYPSLLLEPWLEFHFLRLGKHTTGLALPMRLDFRKDLDLSASVGLGLRWRWYPGWKKEGA